MSARSRAHPWWGPVVDLGVLGPSWDPPGVVTERRVLTREVAGALYVSSLQYITPHGRVEVWRPWRVSVPRLCLSSPPGPPRQQ